MAEFFNYRSPYRSEYYLEFQEFEILLTPLERWLPVFLVFLFAILIVVFRDSFKKRPELDKKARLYVGIIFTIVYLSHYIFRFAIYGFDTIVLPFQLCSISMFLAIMLLFTKNRTIFSFVLYAGVAGGLISLFFPIIGYDANYYRYYQFVIAHIILILTPIYFMAVHGYVSSKRETINGFLILQAIAIFMVIFNYFLGTDFMFVFINVDKIEKFPAIEKFGGIPLYLFWVEIVGISYYIITYKVINFFLKLENKKEEIILE